MHCRLPSQVKYSPGGPPPLVCLIHTSGWYLRAAVVPVLPRIGPPCTEGPPSSVPWSHQVWTRHCDVWMCWSCPGLPSDQAQGLQGALPFALFTLCSLGALALCSVHTPAHSHSHVEDLGMLILATFPSFYQVHALSASGSPLTCSHPCLSLWLDWLWVIDLVDDSELQ